MKSATPILVACALGGCLGAPEPTPPLSGAWGGEHVRLTFAENGDGALEYDCASGRIEGPVTPDRNGAFTTVGVHTPGQGGPAREGEAPPGYPVVYQGRVRGARMTLEVGGEGLEVGAFTLERDAQPRLYRCL